MSSKGRLKQTDAGPFLGLKIRSNMRIPGDQKR